MEEDIRDEKHEDNQSGTDKNKDDIKLKQKPRFIFLKMFLLIVAFLITGGIFFDHFNGIADDFGYFAWVIFLAWLAIPMYIIIRLRIKKHLTVIGFLATFIMLIAILCFIVIIPSLLCARRSAWENRCKLTLRALGATQLAYKENYARRDYLAWHDFPESGYTKENLIDKYKIIIYDTKPSTLNAKGESNNDSTFTIVAIPRYQEKDLRTFAINDYQSPLAWIGEGIKWEKGKESLRDRNLWQQLR